MAGPRTFRIFEDRYKCRIMIVTGKQAAAVNDLYDVIRSYLVRIKCC